MTPEQAKAKNVIINLKAIIPMHPNLSIDASLEAIRALQTALQLFDEVGELKIKLKKMMDGENNWWRERWLKGDYNKILEKKWKTAYQCAENYQKMYEDNEKQLASLKKENEELRKCLKA